MIARLGVLVVALLVVAGLWLPTPRGEQDPLGDETSKPRRRVLLEGVVLSEATPAGDLVVQIDQVVTAPGRIGFLRSPLVPGIELRGVTVARAGEMIQKHDRILLSSAPLEGSSSLAGAIATMTSSMLTGAHAPQ